MYFQLQFDEMATVSAAFSTSIIANQVNFVSPSNSGRRLRILVHRKINFDFKRSSVRRSGRILAARKEEGTAVVNEKEDEYLNKLNGSLNGSYRLNGYVAESGSESLNGSFEKYVNGNGNGTLQGSVGDLVELKADKESKKKKSIEEIGQEEAWFKRSAGDQVEVCIMHMIHFCAS